MKLKNISILYIEEDKVSLKTFFKNMTTSHAKLHTANTLEDGLIICKSQKIDIVLASSIKTLKKIDEMYKNIYLIFCIAELDKSSFKEAINLEVDNFLLKPFQKKSIQKTLTKALQQLKERTSLEKFKESEEKFQQIAQTGIFIYKDKYIYVNQAFCKITGYSKEELYKMHPWEIVNDKNRELVHEICLRRLRGEHFRGYHDLAIVTKKGEIKVNRITTNTIKHDGEYAGLGTCVDVTDMKDVRERLQLLAQAVEQMDEMVRITDVNGKIIYVNDALIKHTKYKKSELIGKSNKIFKSNQHTSSFYDNLWETILSKKSYQGTFINLKKNGEIYYEDQTITPMLDSDNEIKYFVSTSKDITSRIQTEHQLKLLATTDALTGIYNRYKINLLIEDELSRVKRYGDSFALIMFDIDFFKKVNDTFGHDIGDYVLQELSDIISDSIRESDKFGRWGGEEFMILAPKLTKDEAINLAEKLRKRVEEHVFKDIGHISVSLGVVISDILHDKERMLKDVDNALYEAKNSGRNRLAYV